MMENDEMRGKPRRTMEDLQTFRSTGTSSLSNPPSLPPPPPSHKKGRIVPLQINDRYHLKVLFSSPEAVLLPNQVDLEFKDSRDS